MNCKGVTEVTVIRAPRHQFGCPQRDTCPLHRKRTVSIKAVWMFMGFVLGMSRVPFFSSSGRRTTVLWAIRSISRVFWFFDLKETNLLKLAWRFGSLRVLITSLHLLPSIETNSSRSIALSMFLTPLATIYTSMCVNLLIGGVSTGIKRYDFLLSRPSTSLNQFFFAKHKESILRKIFEGFWHGGDRSSYVCFGFDNSRNPERLNLCILLCSLCTHFRWLHRCLTLRLKVFERFKKQFESSLYMYK